MNGVHPGRGPGAGRAWGQAGAYDIGAAGRLGKVRGGGWAWGEKATRGRLGQGRNGVSSQDKRRGGKGGGV